MAAPDNSSYVLMSGDDSLPASRVLLASGGLFLDDTGNSGAVIINTVGNLANLNQFGVAGYVTYNTGSNTFQPITFLEGTGIQITNPSGQSASTFSVVDNTTTQRVQVAADGLVLSTRDTINFISDATTSITVVDNPGEGTAEIRISAGAPIDPGIIPAQGTMLVGDGTQFVGFPIGPLNSIMTSSGSSPEWVIADIPQTIILSPTDNNIVLENNVRYVPMRPTPFDPVHFDLPAVPVAGEIYRVSGFGAGGWGVFQQAGQTIHFLGQNTTTGTAGRLLALGTSLGNSVFDSVEILCVVDGVSPFFTVTACTGNITIV